MRLDELDGKVTVGGEVKRRGLQPGVALRVCCLGRNHAQDVHVRLMPAMACSTCLRKAAF